MTERPLDEVSDVIRDIEQDPIGALMAIQQLAGETDVLRAEVARLREALEMLRNLVWPHPSEDTERYREQVEACDFADEVLSHGEADQ